MQRSLEQRSKVSPVPTNAVSEKIRKKLDRAKLHGAKLFQRNCQNIPGVSGAAAGAAAASASAATSAACIYYVVLGGRFAPP